MNQHRKKEENKKNIIMSFIKSEVKNTFVTDSRIILGNFLESLDIRKRKYKEDFPKKW